MSPSGVRPGFRLLLPGAMFPGPMFLAAMFLGALGVAGCGSGAAADATGQRAHTARAAVNPVPATPAAPAESAAPAGSPATDGPAVDTSPARQAVAISGTTTPAPETAPPAALDSDEVAPGAASLYARLGEVLVPLACKGPHGWHTGRICLPDDVDANVNVTLQPILKGEPKVRSASSASIPFVLSGTEEPGLVLVDRERQSAAANRPLLGFGLVGSSAQVRYTRAGAARVEQEIAAWCKASKGGCQGIAGGSMARLVGRAGRTREQNDLVAQVRQAIAPLDEALPIKVIALFAVSVGGRQQRIADVEVETSKATSP
ncbi:MAG: hypothetical protein ABI895_41285, partial [Deltaproteobacteria bacterium]